MRENQDRADEIEHRHDGDDKTRKAKAAQRSAPRQIEQCQCGTERHAEERRVFFDAKEQDKEEHRPDETPQQKRGDEERGVYEVLRVVMKAVDGVDRLSLIHI